MSQSFKQYSVFIGRLVGYVWSVCVLVITWVSDWAILNGHSSIWGISVFDVKDSSSLALLLFPAAFLLLLFAWLQKYTGWGSSKSVAIGQYQNVLGEWLRRSFGGGITFNKAQIDKGISALKLNKYYLTLAYAMYLSRSDYEDLIVSASGIKSYESMRKEVSTFIGSISIRDEGWFSDSADGNDGGGCDGGSGDG